MKVVLASKSKTKIEAVLDAFGDTSIHLETISAPSGVNEQPMDDETLTGAFNRLSAAKEDAPGADLYIAIENGVFLEHRDFIDRAVVVIAAKDAEPQVFYSEGVMFPREAVLEAKKRGLDHTTIGAVLKEMGLVKLAYDPHLDLRAKSRTAILTQTLKTAIATLELNEPA